MTTTATHASVGPLIAAGVTPLPFDFQAISAGEIEVTREGAVANPNSYSVLLNGDGTGSITPLTTWGTDEVYIYSSPTYQQPADFARFGALYPDQLNTPLDRLARALLALRVWVTRQITASLLAIPAGPTGDGLSTLSALTYIVAVEGDVAYLGEPGREGMFVFRETNLSTQVTADPLQGLYVAPALDPTGGSGAWVRQWDGVNGRPEWFGAVPSSIGTDNAAALAACIALCPVTHLAKKWYYIQSTVMVGVLAKRAIIGVPGPYDADGDGSALVLTGASAGTATILQMGPTAIPATIPNNVGYESRVYGVNLIRNAACVPHASGDLVNYPKGLDFRGSLACFAEEMKIVESSVGVNIIGVVNSDLKHIQVTRNNPGTSAINDYYTAYLIGGAAANYGYVGANASLRLARCIANGFHAQHDDPHGMQIYGFISDTWITDFDKAAIANGIKIDGTAGAATDTKHVDVYITDARIDGGTGTGITVQNLNSHAAVHIVAPYVAPNATTTGQAAVRISACLGGVSITEGQLLCFAPGAQLFGVDVQNSSGVNVDESNLIVGAYIPVNLNTSTDFHITPMIYNPTEVASGAAVVATACSVGYLQPTVKGGATRFTYGVNLSGAGNSFIEVNWSKINKACLTGALATNRLIHNAVTIVAVGAFGTNSAASGTV